MRRAQPLLLALLAAAAVAHCAWASGVFELQVLSFSNARRQLAGGGCCGGGAAPGGAGAAECTAPCRTRFELCLKEYQSAAAPGACSFGRASSPPLGTDSFTLAEPLYTLALDFSFRWTRSFTLILQAYDDYNYTDPDVSGLIEEAWWSGIVEPGAAWHALRHSGAAAAVAYRVRVLCQPNYYNSTCTTFCRARNDSFGHYTCSSHGAKLCAPGWRSDNCDKPVCKEGCHPIHGNCDRPGECNCRPGWRGELCSQCQPYPGCKHGYCNGSSWDCTCDTNWGGILCDQDLNYCGTHEPCQHGGTCENTAPDQYLCTCAEGFSGTECERAEHACAPQPCAHGACSLTSSPPGYRCSCEPGWAGAACDVDEDDCASAPCLHGAECRDRLAGFDCLCSPGRAGPTCADDVDECALTPSPCVNAAACTNTAGGYTCTCLAGWEGRDCARNVDDCTDQCLHGSTCIDLVDDFHCACAPGYAGRRCERDVDDCASRPCRNGGECQDLLDAYRCICPVGFAGKDCEDDRDHCAEAPCANGATCYTAQSDYYCHCAGGWSGRNCTTRAPEPCAGTCARGRCVRARCLCDPGYTGAHCDTPLECGGCGAGSCVVAGGEARCVCAEGWTGPACDQEIDDCSSNPCQNNATCVDGLGDITCLCLEGWTGKSCSDPTPLVPAVAAAAGAWCAGVCLQGGTCARTVAGWACACAPGRGGARCERQLPPPPPAAPAPPALPPRCACPAPASCAPRRERCVCPEPPDPACLEMIGGLEYEQTAAEAAAHEDWALQADSCEAGPAGRGAGDAGAAWWWGCNVCWCGGGGGCTRLWCGAADCLSGAAPAGACRGDEVCVPAAPALCLRPPCTGAPGECRRVSARRVAPPASPAPPGCWPGAAPAAALPGCARVQLELARERLAPGAHVERACAALRRALAAALAPRTTPLALLCDLAADDDDSLDLALWVGEEEGAAGTEALAAALRALHSLLARRRLAHHALLGAALRVRAAPPREAQPQPSDTSRSAPLAALLGAGTFLLVLAACAALYVRRRRRRRAERQRRDEEKSNNLQNEENLRRYANPLRATPLAPAPPHAQAHSLYKAHNADARNNTPHARSADKEVAMRALPPPAPPPPELPARAPPERLQVLV